MIILNQLMSTIQGKGTQVLDLLKHLKSEKVSMQMQLNICVDMAKEWTQRVGMLKAIFMYTIINYDKEMK